MGYSEVSACFLVEDLWCVGESPDEVLATTTTAILLVKVHRIKHHVYQTCWHGMGTKILANCMTLL